MARHPKKALKNTSKCSTNLQIGKVSHLYSFAMASLFVLFLQSFPIPVFAQTASSTGCKILDSHRPPISIELAPSQDGFKKQRQVGFTLENNTNCSIHIPGNADGESLRYDIQNSQRSNLPSHRGYWIDGHQSFYKEVAPGQIVLFGIAEKHAKSRLTISIQYIFTWEIEAKGGYFEHRVYFDSAKWPRGE